ncbi:STAS domain-containing protein [Pseudonocardia sp. N23]|uniref:STAS domain-containing protein n=1 Tax=Pseudonocardia sp. N23 TaxID=1987376 RepID=UPI000BFCE364|nr:STAS domain-containing protein [Pseudonocardia sp. N23]GAY11821.1 hypothetical protein TOK_0206 [Pseudonocardia sp. N23]
MHSTFTIQLAVERSPRGHVVRAAGELSARTGGRLIRLVDKLVDDTPRPAGPRALVIDLAQIRSFDTDGVEALRRAYGRAGSAGVGLCLTGLDGRRSLLPHDVDGLLDRLPVVGATELAPVDKPRRHLAAATA